MCNECGETCGRGVPTPLGYRNAVLTGFTDRDVPPSPNTTGQPVRPKTYEDVILYFHAMHGRYERLMAAAAYDHSHPVDDYAPQGMLTGGSPALGSNLVLNIPTDYDMPVRYESCAVLIPAGALTVSLQLGQRYLQLRTAQNPITGTVDPGQLEPAWMNLTFTGVILNSNDPRVLTVVYANVAASATQVGTTTPTEPHVSLTGYALTRGQWS
jgi:hypothetical protein